MDLLQVLVYIYSVPHVKHKFREEEEYEQEEYEETEHEEEEV